jgi:hypothetical protein
MLPYRVIAERRDRGALVLVYGFGILLVEPLEHDVQDAASLSRRDARPQRASTSK